MRSPTRSCARSTAQPSTPGPREEVYCTKVGTTRPDEMYIVGAPHGRPRLGRGRQRRRLGHGARDGAGAHLQHARRADRALDPLRRCGTTRRPGSTARAPTSSSARRCRARRTAGLRPLSRAEVARHDPARHDAVRSRHAARRRHDQPGAAARGRRQHRVPVELEDGGAVAGARLGPPRGQREVRDRLSRPRSART